MGYSIGYKILKNALCVLSAVLLLLAMLATYCAECLTNNERYRADIFTDNFDQITIYEYNECIEKTSSTVEIDTATLRRAVTTSQILVFEHNYVINLLDSIIGNEEITFENFKSDQLKATVEKEIYDYCNENGLVYSEESTQEIYNYIVNYIDSTLKFVPKTILKYVNKLSGPISFAVKFAKWQLPLYFLALVCFFINISICSKERRIKVILGSIKAYWVAVSTVTVPALLLMIYNIPKRIALSKNLFYYFVKSVCNVAINDLVIIFAIAFSFFTITMIAIDVRLYKRRRHRGRIRAHIDENGEIYNEII